PRSLTEAEHAALLDRCRRANMALYASPTGGEADPMIAVRLGEQFGLVHLDHNPGADERGITALTYVPGSRYIPYSNRPIHWHTDGYYNRPDRQIRGMLLHCVAQAGEGGESGLLDHELAYIAVRDADEALYAALCEPDVMTIPGNREDPRVMRPDRSGPVFWVDPETGTLQMRYTARARNIVWKAEPQVTAARELLARLPETSPHCLRATLQPGWGLLCNNVLHDRTGFLDQEGEPHRLLYRGRYYDRIAGT
ncbi:MAG: taurine catabolism dioxygenase TauD, partial [Nitrospirae bacterium]